MPLKTDPRAVVVVLVLAATMLLLAACTIDRDNAGRIAEKVARTAAAEGRERAPTVIAGAKKLGSTAAVEVGERAPTVGVEAATAAQEFSRDLQNSEICSGAAGVLLSASLALAIIRCRSG